MFWGETVSFEMITWQWYIAILWDTVREDQTTITDNVNATRANASTAFRVALLLLLESTVSHTLTSPLTAHSSLWEWHFSIKSRVTSTLSHEIRSLFIPPPSLHTLLLPQFYSLKDASLLAFSLTHTQSLLLHREREEWKMILRYWSDIKDKIRQED